MHDEGDRQLASRTLRLDLHAPNLVTVCAGEAELLERHRIEFGQQVAVDVCQLRDFARSVDAVNVVRGHDAVGGVDRAAPGQRYDVAGMAGIGQPYLLAGRGGDAEDGRFHHVFGSDV